MRYEDIQIEVVDRDFLDFDNKYTSGSVVLRTSDSLITETNKLRKQKGYTDLVSADLNNEVYYEFYLLFDTKKHAIKLQAVCNYGEFDDETIYTLPTNAAEEKFLLFKLLESLAYDIYTN